MTQPKFHSFAEFWPYYLGEHSKPATRVLHYAGSLAALALLIALIAAGKWWLLPLAFVPGYGLAWVGHFFVEKNSPATFRYPLLSLRADFRMYRLAWLGRVDAEIARLAADIRKVRP